MAKLEAGRTVLTPVNFDLCRLVDDLHGMFKLKADDKNLALILNTDSALPQYLCGDQGKIRQVLINLLNNAIKFTREGDVRLEITSNQTVPGENTSENTEVPIPVRFTVTDTGPGIAEQELADIFQPFVQTQTGRDSQEGTGLGLAISRQFVQLMGGELSITNRADGAACTGVVASFSIPLVPTTPENLPTAPIKRHIIGLAAGQPSYQILVVDDKAANRKLLMKLLRPIGFQVKEAQDGQAAVEITKSWQPDLIFMDLRMPKLNGFEAVKQIRAYEASLNKLGENELTEHESASLHEPPHPTANPTAQGTRVEPLNKRAPKQPLPKQQSRQGKVSKIIALSATSYQSDRRAAYATGCDDFIRKPFRNTAIFEALVQHLGVEYRYRDDTETEGLTSDETRQIDSIALGSLPDPLLKDLESATRRLQWNRLLELVEEIRTHDATLADTLMDTINNFQYMQILESLESIAI